MEIKIEEIAIGILIINRNYKIIFGNEYVHSLFHYNSNELIGKHINILIPQELHNKHQQLAENYWNENYGKITSRLGMGRKVEGVTKDNQKIPVEIGLYTKDEFIIAFVIDIAIEKIKDTFSKIDIIFQQLQEIATNIKP